jgi:CMP-N-acetylneuraminic acid synthetase
MKCICVIPARGGSKRLPRKNIKRFLGEPIIMRPIRAAHASGLFERVIVSTDDTEIASTVRGFALPEWRNPELCQDHVPDIDVVQDIAARHNDMDYLCYLYPTAALVTVDQILHGLDYMLRSESPMVYCEYDDFSIDAGQFSWYNLHHVRAGFDIRTLALPFLVSHWEAQDINTAEDFELAELKAMRIQE